MELDDDQDSLVIWKMGQFDFSFRGVACKGSGTAEAAGKESSPFHRQTGSPRISPVTGILNNVHISFSTVHREKTCTVLSRRGRSNGGREGSEWILSKNWSLRGIMEKG